MITILKIILDHTGSQSYYSFNFRVVLKPFIIERWIKIPSMAMGTERGKDSLENEFYLTEEFQEAGRELNLLK